MTPTTPFIISLVSAFLIVIFMIIPLGFARYHRGFTFYYFDEPRIIVNQLKPWERRIEWAHKNSLESFLLHSPALLLAILSILHFNITMSQISVQSAYLYPIFRIFYLISYIAKRSILRAFFWGGGVCCSGVIYFESCKLFFNI